jgi:hypothetical protein
MILHQRPFGLRQVLAFASFFDVKSSYIWDPFLSSVLRERRKRGPLRMIDLVPVDRWLLLAAKLAKIATHDSFDDGKKEATPQGFRKEKRLNGERVIGDRQAAGGGRSRSFLGSD